MLKQPFISYELIDFKVGLEPEEVNFFTIENDNAIERIEFSTISKEVRKLKSITIYYKEDTDIDDDMVNKANQMFKNFIFNIIGEDNNIIYFDYRYYVYNPCKKYSIIESNILQDTLPLRDAAIPVCHNLKIQDFKKLFENKSKDSENFYEDLDVLMTILKIKEVTLRYLMLYEFLRVRITVPDKNPIKNSQKDVTDFIRDKYNPVKPVNFIGFKPTRRKDKDYKEDDITYYRNLIAHSDTKNLESKNLENEIRRFSIVLVDVIYHLLSGKYKV